MKAKVLDRPSPYKPSPCEFHPRAKADAWVASRTQLHDGKFVPHGGWHLCGECWGQKVVGVKA